MDKRNFAIVFFIILLLAFGNVFIYFNKTKLSFSTFAISDIGKRIVKLDLSTIIFIAQWLIILVIVLIFYIKFLKHKKEEKISSKSLEIKEKKGTGTDLDTLYDLLKERKNLKISIIAKTFKINDEKALEWCKILENYNLATIEYPAFAEPEVGIKL